MSMLRIAVEYGLTEAGESGRTWGRNRQRVCAGNEDVTLT